MQHFTLASSHTAAFDLVLVCSLLHTPRPHPFPVAPVLSGCSGIHAPYRPQGTQISPPGDHFLFYCAGESPGRFLKSKLVDPPP